MSIDLKERKATAADHAEFARLFRELGHDDPVPTLEHWLAEWAPCTFFLEQDERTVGYAYVETYATQAYIRHVVIAPEARGRGLGDELMRRIAVRQRAAGCTRWELNVRHDNHAAIALYRRFGMSEEYATHVLRIDWEAADRMPVQLEGLEARSLAPSRDREVEERFRLPLGMLAQQRATHGSLLLELVDRSSQRPRAFARFDPAFPGAFPFRVDEPGLVGALLSAMRPHARGDTSWVQLVIEGDAVSAGALLDAGARTVWEIRHFSGAIPVE